MTRTWRGGIVGRRRGAGGGGPVARRGRQNERTPFAREESKLELETRKEEEEEASSFLVRRRSHSR